MTDDVIKNAICYTIHTPGECQHHGIRGKMVYYDIYHRINNYEVTNQCNDPVHQSHEFKEFKESKDYKHMHVTFHGTEKQTLCSLSEKKYTEKFTDSPFGKITDNVSALTHYNLNTYLDNQAKLNVHLVGLSDDFDGLYRLHFAIMVRGEIVNYFPSDFQKYEPYTFEYQGNNKEIFLAKIKTDFRETVFNFDKASVSVVKADPFKEKKMCCILM